MELKMCFGMNEGEKGSVKIYANNNETQSNGVGKNVMVVRVQFYGRLIWHDI